MMVVVVVVGIVIGLSTQNEESTTLGLKSDLIVKIQGLELGLPNEHLNLSNERIVEEYTNSKTYQYDLKIEETEAIFGEWNDDRCNNQSIEDILSSKLNCAKEVIDTKTKYTNSGWFEITESDKGITKIEFHLENTEDLAIAGMSLKLVRALNNMYIPEWSDNLCNNDMNVRCFGDRNMEWAFWIKQNFDESEYDSDQIQFDNLRVKLVRDPGELFEWTIEAI